MLLETMALCRALQLSASIAGTSGAMHHVYATIAVKNTSGAPCALDNRPFVAIVDDRQKNNRHIPFSLAQRKPDIGLMPGQSASFAVGWPTMGPSGEHCEVGPNDAWLYASGGGLPLWLPLYAGSCAGEPTATLFQLGVPQPAVTPPPDEGIGANYDRWSAAQPCHIAFESTLDYKRHIKPATPKVHDALTIKYPSAVISEQPTRPGVTWPSVWLDPQRGIFTETAEDFDTQYADACGEMISIPPMGKRRSIATFATVKGASYGMTPAQVQKIEGPASLNDISPNTQTLIYRWKNGASQDADTMTLTFAFWKNALFGIHYEDAPPYHGP